MTAASLKADVLCEALPFIRRFSGRVVVVKYGGSALGDGSSVKATDFAGDVALLRSVGLLPVVVHGGGPQIGELMKRLGKEPEFRGGLRVTDAETLEIVRMVLVGKVNRELVASLNMHGPIAVGLSGEDAGLITAVAADPSLGFVGEVERIDTTLLTRLLAEGLVPVLATIGSDASGQAYNINADSVAGAVATALGAEKLIFLSDVAGVYADPSREDTKLSSTTAAALEDMIASGAVSSGMIPKARACTRAVRDGVASAHILDGRLRHALLLELLTPEGIGTMVTAR